MSNKDFANKIAIVGVGASNFRELWDKPDKARTQDEMFVAAFKEALDDAGLQLSQIDGLIAGGTSYVTAAYRCGMKRARYVNEYQRAGRQMPTMLSQAAGALLSGMANYVVAFNSVAFRAQGNKFGGVNDGDLYDRPYGMTSAGATYAMGFTRYQHLYGAKEEELGEIAVQIRNHAVNNPRAILRDRITLDEYVQARYIAKPLRLYDYCLINDGAVALILTTADRARALKQKPVYFTSIATQVALFERYLDPELWTTACQGLKRDGLDSVGVTLKDIDCVQMYDNFSVAALWGLEGLGFAPRGEGLKWIKGGRISHGGELPVNTSGGMMAEAFLQGWNAHAEAVRQLRGTAINQVPNCKRVLYFCLSAVPGVTLMTNEP